jgi:hypothetical protein
MELTLANNSFLITKNLSYNKPFDANNHSLINVFIVILGLIFVFSLILNILSVLTIINVKMYTSINLLILNLTISDLIYTVGIPFFSVHLLKKNWTFGIIGCKIFYFTEFTGIISSILTVSMLSVERFCDVTDFFKRNTRNIEFFAKHKIAVYISIIWIVSLLFIIPLLSSIKLIKHQDEYSCGSEWSDTSLTVFLMLKFVLIFLLPYIIIVVSSMKLLLYLNDWRRRSKRNLRQRNFELQSKSKENHTESGLKKNSYLSLVVTKTELKTGDRSASVNLIVIQEDENALNNQDHSRDDMCICARFAARTRRTKRKNYMSSVRRKAVRLVLSIVFVFILQWSPLWIFQFILNFSNSNIKNVQIINISTSTLSYTNTVANPILYILLTSNFKQYLKNNLPKLMAVF